MVKIFAEVYFLYKQLKAAIIAERKLFNTITVVIILNTLYNNFETIMASIFETKNKSIEEI